MKKLIAVLACTMPMVFASPLYAQDKSADTATKTSDSPAPVNTAPTAIPGIPARDAAAKSTMNNEKANMDKQQNISGVSVKNSIMGKSVHNEADEKIGDISDVVLASDGQAAYFVVGAGGFLGMGEHNVAIPYDKIQQNGDKLVLPGYTKDQLKALPKVEVQG